MPAYNNKGEITRPQGWSFRVIYDSDLPQTHAPKRIKIKHKNKPKGFSVSTQDIMTMGGGSTLSEYMPVKRKGVCVGIPVVTDGISSIEGPLLSTMTETVEEEYVLSGEQRKIYDAVVQEQKNVFFTGAAGTGKSYLLKSIISSLRRNIKEEEVAITASTGIAALNIKGTTFHRFAGVGLGEGTTDQLVNQTRRNPDRLKSWLNTKVLVIDEISMISAVFFDKVEELARRLRQNPKPFGGIQLILTGDFFQLPPVGKSEYTFEAECWDKVVHVAIVLKKVFRQKDEKFAVLLNDMRIGKMSEETIAVLSSLSRNLKLRKPLTPAELYPVRQQVDFANSMRLKSLAGTRYIFESHDTGSTELLKDCMAPSVLELKKGAQVMLIKNLSKVLVNGSIGIVEDFTLSTDINTQTNQSEVLKIAGRTNRGMPIVRFSNGERVPITRQIWETTSQGEITASRTQIPLILAWAMSIHKSQGQTIEYVKVDLMKIFERGQAYVALSRTTSLDNLQVLNFDPQKVKVDPRVVEFYRKL